MAHFIERIGSLPGVTVRRVFPVGPGRRPGTIPRAYVEWDVGIVRVTVQEIVDSLLDGDPPIVVGAADDALVLNPQTLDPGEEEIIADRLHQLLNDHIGTT